MLTDAEPLRNLGHRISTLGDLSHRIALELITEVGLPHHRLLSSKLGSKASRNLGATHYDPEALNLMDEFSDNICAYVEPFDGNLKLVSVETLR
jgi:hypothetical protein